MPIKQPKEQDEISEEVEIGRMTRKVVILLENAPEGMRLIDFPERLQPAVCHAHLKQKIRKPWNQDRYFHPLYAPKKKSAPAQNPPQQMSA